MTNTDTLSINTAGRDAQPSELLAQLCPPCLPPSSTLLHRRPSPTGACLPLGLGSRDHPAVLAYGCSLFDSLLSEPASCSSAPPRLCLSYQFQSLRHRPLPQQESSPLRRRFCSCSVRGRTTSSLLLCRRDHAAKGYAHAPGRRDRSDDNNTREAPQGVGCGGGFERMKLACWWPTNLCRSI